MQLTFLTVRCLPTLERSARVATVALLEVLVGEGVITEELGDTWLVAVVELGLARRLRHGKALDNTLAVGMCT